MDRGVLGFLIVVAATLEVQRRRKVKPVTTPVSKQKANVLSNSIKRVEKHIVVCGLSSPNDWPKRIEDSDSEIVGRLSKMIEDFNTDPHKRPIKITGCDLSNSISGFTDVIVFPQNRVYRINEANLLSFATLVTDPLPLTPQGGRTRWPRSMFQDVDLPFKTLVLICSHMKRDKRCGTAGPKLVEAAKQILADSGVTKEDICVAASSHIGGHEFAGTLIVYPQGECYGHVHVDVLKRLINSIQSNDLSCRPDECLRGSTLLQW